MEQVKVFLDTNVLLDYFTGRMGDGVAEKIVIAGSTPYYRICISVLTGVNALYVIRKCNKSVTASLLQKMFTILPMTPGQWNDSLQLDVEDTEDALQLACARENACHVMVTRDRHLLSTPTDSLRIISPAEFVAAITE